MSSLQPQIDVPALHQCQPTRSRCSAETFVMLAREPSSVRASFSSMNDCLKFILDRFYTVGDKLCLYLKIIKCKLQPWVVASNWENWFFPLLSHLFLHLWIILHQASLLRSITKRFGPVRGKGLSSITHFYWWWQFLQVDYKGCVKLNSLICGIV